MATFEEIAIALKRFQQFLDDGAEDILLRAITNLRSVILERVARGKNINGSNFSEYSDKKVNPSLFQDIDTPAGARNFIQKSIKNKEKISYLDIRDAFLVNSLKTKNFFFSGEMLKSTEEGGSIDEDVLRKGRGNYELIIEPRDEENRQKLIANEKREREDILAFSQSELDNLVEDIEAELLQKLIDLIGP